MPVNETVERIIFEGVDKITAASKTAEASTKQLQSVLSTVKDALGAIGVTVGVGAFVKLQLDALHATAALKDMSEQTGASVEQLSAIQRVAKVGGHDFEGLTAQLGRMVKGLKENKEEGTASTRALAQLGISAREVNGQWRDTGNILIEVAQKMGRFRTDADRVAFIQDALGKGAERYIPLLKDIAEGTDLVSKKTTAQAEQANEAEKALRRLGLATEDARDKIALGLTPALTKVLEILNKIIEIRGGIGPTFWDFLTSSPAKALFEARPGGPSAADKVRELNEELAQLEAKKATFAPQIAQGGAYEARARDQLARIDRQIEELKKRRDIAAAIQMAMFQEPQAGGAMDMGVGLAGLFDERKDYIQDDPRRLKPSDIAKMQEEAKAELQRQNVEMDRYLDQVQKARITAQQDAQRESDASNAQLAEEETERRAQIETAKFERLKLIRAQGYDDEESRENEFYEARKNQLQVFTDKELEAYGGRAQLIEQMEREHADRVFQIRTDALNRQRNMVVSGYRGQAQAIFGELQNMTAGVAQHSRLLFEINKVATIATIILKTPEAIAGAYAFGAKFGGPPLGAAMATVAGLAMAAQLAAATKATFQGGGGGVAPSAVGTTAATPVSPVPAEPAGPRTSVTIHLSGDEPVSMSTVRKFLEQVAEASEDGARVFVQ